MTAVPGRRPVQRVAVTYLSGECAGSGLGAAGWGRGLLVPLAATLHRASPGWSLDCLSAQIPEKAPCFSKSWNRSTRDKKGPRLRQVQQQPVGRRPTCSAGPALVGPLPFRPAPGEGTVPSWALGTYVLLLPLHTSALRWPGAQKHPYSMLRPRLSADFPDLHATAPSSGGRASAAQPGYPSQQLGG